MTNIKTLLNKISSSFKKFKTTNTSNTEKYYYDETLINYLNLVQKEISDKHKGLDIQDTYKKISDIAENFKKNEKNFLKNSIIKDKKNIPKVNKLCHDVLNSLKNEINNYNAIKNYLEEVEKSTRNWRRYKKEDQKTEFIKSVNNTFELMAKINTKYEYLHYYRDFVSVFLYCLQGSEGRIVHGSTTEFKILQKKHVSFNEKTKKFCVSKDYGNIFGINANNANKFRKYIFNTGMQEKIKKDQKQEEEIERLLEDILYNSKVVEQA